MSTCIFCELPGVPVKARRCSSGTRRCIEGSFAFAVRVHNGVIVTPIRCCPRTFGLVTSRAPWTPPVMRCCLLVLAWWLWLCHWATAQDASFNRDSAMHVADILSAVFDAAAVPSRSTALVYSRGVASDTPIGTDLGTGVYARLLSQVINNPSVTSFYVGTDAGLFSFAGRLAGTATTNLSAPTTPRLSLCVAGYTTPSTLCTSSTNKCPIFYSLIDVNGDPTGVQCPGTGGSYNHVVR